MYLAVTSNSMQDLMVLGNNMFKSTLKSSPAYIRGRFGGSEHSSFTPNFLFYREVILISLV